MSSLQVLQSFYFPSAQADPQNIGRAQEWLIAFQKSQQVWQVAPQLLQVSNVVEFQYFGASSLEGKIKAEWQTMPSELRSAMLEQLLLLLKSAAHTMHRTVVTRLCLAVSVIACHSTPDLWHTPIPDILSFAFTTDTLTLASGEHLPLILELLTIFPDELLNCDYITQERRNKVGIEFARHSETVIRVLTHLLTCRPACPTQMLRATLRCLKSWVLFDIPTAHFLGGSLLSDAFDAAAKDAQLIEDFVLLLDEIFTFMNGKHLKLYPLSFTPLVGRILDFIPQYFVLAQREDNSRIYTAIFLLLAHIPETHPKLLLASDHNVRYMRVLTELATLGGPDICEMLAPVVTEIQSLVDNDIDATVWHPFLSDTIEILRVRCRFPEDDMDQQEQDAFYEFRQVAGDTLLSIYGMLESKVMQQLLACLWQDINNFATSTWQSIEATIFLLGCLSDGITEDESLVPQLFHLLGGLPAQSTPLIKSTMVLAGKYSGQLERSTQFLNKIIGDFIPAFGNAELASTASESFLSITKNKRCAALLATNINQLISLCEPLLAHHSDSTRKILEGLFEVVSVLPPTDTLNYISPLISPHIARLSGDGSPGAKKNTQDLENSINIFTSLFRIFDDDSESPDSSQDSNGANGAAGYQTHPLLPIVQALLPRTGALLNQHANNRDLVESIALLYKKIIMTCGKNYESFLATVIAHMTESFVRCPQAQLLNSLSVGVSTLPSDQRHDYLTQSLTSITKSVIEIWRAGGSMRVGVVNTPSPYNLSISPDITKEFFSLIQQCIKYNVLSLPAGIIDPLFHIPLENILNIQDKSTARPTLTFLAVLISQVIYALVSYHPNSFRPVALQLLSVQGFPSVHVTALQKEKFVANVMRNRAKSQFRKVIQDFSLSCVGITGIDSKGI
eukprot:gene1519-1775_t